MITSDKRQSIYQLHQHGHSVRKISKLMQISRTTVKRVIAEKGELRDKTETLEDQALNERIAELYKKCSGRAQRVYEKLVDSGLEISYPAVTRRIRLLKLAKEPKRAERFPDEPGDDRRQVSRPKGES